MKVVKDKLGNTVAIELEELVTSIREKSDYVFAFSSQFKTLGYGKNADEAVQNLKNALDIFFNVHVERGTLEKALQELGWVKVDDAYRKPGFSKTLKKEEARILSYA